MKLTKSLDENIKSYENAFKDCGDVVKKKFPLGQNQDLFAYISYIDMMVNRNVIEDQVINRLTKRMFDETPSIISLRDALFDPLGDGGITVVDFSETDELSKICDAVLCGDTVLMFEGLPEAVIISTKGWPNRGVPSAETEVVVQGSKEAFSEVFRINTMLIRRRIRDTKLKVYQTRVGRRSKTDVALMYMDDVVRPEVLEEAKRRIKNIDIDGIFDSGYIDQLIEEDWLSPFPQAQVTERPDKASSAILEGRIVVVVDNSPCVLIIPATLNTFFQSSEDYYQRFQIMSFVRLIRFVSGFIAVALPGLYLATAVYHPSMIPMLLAIKMAGSRMMVPFPAVVEILLMDLAFELIREAGIRLPGPIGSTIGIVGGLIIGQAAVEAGIVSPIVVIIIALTGIAGFSIPHTSLVTGFRLTKYFIIITSAVLGLYGFWLGLLLVVIHLASLKSFGMPYLYPFASGEINGYTDFKDTFLRLPLFTMKRRPFFADPNQQNRLDPEKIQNNMEKE